MKDRGAIPAEIMDRATAYTVLKAHEAGKRLDLALAGRLASYPANLPGKNLVTELVCGVVRQKARLDHHLLFFYPEGSPPFLPVSC